MSAAPAGSSDMESPIAVLTDRMACVQLVLRPKSNDHSLLTPITSSAHQADIADFDHWGWSLLIGYEPLEPERGYLFPAIPAAIANPQRWSAHGYPDDEQLFVAMLTDMQGWRGVGIPAICGHLPAARISDAVRRWRTYIAPAAAQIIQGLYCPATGWIQARANVMPEWLGAAAKLTRGWLAFYDVAGTLDREHKANELKLRRLLALTLARLALHSSSHANWVYQSSGKPETPFVQASTLLDALERWQAICFDNGSAWLFDGHWWISEEGRDQARRRTRAERREIEVDVLMTLIQRLLAVDPGAGNHAAADDFHDRLLVLLDDAARIWYRPRYDLERAGSLESLVGWARAHPQQMLQSAPHSRLERAWRWWVGRGIWISGLVRLYAGTLVGYLATGFASDTWKFLLSFDPMSNGFASWRLRELSILGGLAAVCAIASMLYLFNIIRARGVPRVYSKTLNIWLCGELCALAIGISLAWFVAPLVTYVPIDEWFKHGSALFVAGSIYAQLAVFIGIFTQMIFDDRPPTSRVSLP